MELTLKLHRPDEKPVDGITGPPALLFWLYDTGPCMGYFEHKYGVFADESGDFHACEDLVAWAYMPAEAEVAGIARGASASEQEPQQEEEQLDWRAAERHVYEVWTQSKFAAPTPKMNELGKRFHQNSERTKELFDEMMALGGADWQGESAPRES